MGHTGMHIRLTLAWGCLSQQSSTWGPAMTISHVTLMLLFSLSLVLELRDFSIVGVFALFYLCLFFIIFYIQYSWVQWEGMAGPVPKSVTEIAWPDFIFNWKILFLLNSPFRKINKWFLVPFKEIEWVEIRFCHIIMATKHPWFSGTDPVSNILSCPPVVFSYFWLWRYTASIIEKEAFLNIKLWPGL